MKSLFVILFSLCISICSYAGTASNTNILILLSYHTSLPWTQSYLNGLEIAQKKFDGRIQYFLEIMDSIRLNDSMSDKNWYEYLREKYKNIRFDAAIAESAKASSFLNEYGKPLLGEIPTIYYTGEYTEFRHYAKTLKLQERKAVEGTLQIALRQNPHAKKIYIIDGSDIDSKNILKILLPLVENVPNKDLNIIKDFTIDELMKAFSRISGDSIIFYNLVFTDRSGKKYVPKTVLSDLVKISPAPIYSFWSSLMGSGAVGGRMIDGEETAIQMVTAAMDYLHYGEFKDRYDTLQTIIDWNAVQRYGIDSPSLPEDAKLINKPVPLLEDYYNEIIIITILILAAAILVIVWLKKLTELNAKLQSEKTRAETIARKDILTGMHNRLAFYEKSEQVCNEANRLNKPISIILLDIDYFKSINDKYGHFAGDEVIRIAANIIETSKRDIDISARFGGEEFVIMLPFSDINGGEKLAKRVIHECEKTKVRYEDKSITFTISAGVSSTAISSSVSPIDDLIKNADMALYRAKECGRNQVCIQWV